ncbi:MAG TPA: hypothetical protein PKB10_13285 [Tepidisphaeraceae bacterium]|nr:hypothetical protein [Tepidisphaeraceae bacterium]
METVAIDKVTSIEELAERVQQTGRGLTLTRNGAPLADIVPHAVASDADDQRVFAEIERHRQSLPPITIDEILSSIREGRR